ncbi:MAG: TlpA family protein disulfide reductase [Pontibacter sp.]|nr:TlpA family protein disulfide reductase [Pontibacter sp.]
MKQLNIVLLCLLFLAARPLFAQNGAVISGSITSPLTSQVEVVQRPNEFIPEEQTLEAELEGNKFILRVPIDKPTVVELLHGDEVVPVYLEPGYELKLQAKGSKFLKSLKYKGKGADENNYLVSYTTRFEEEEDYQVLPDNVKLREQEFTQFLDYRRQDQVKSLEKYAAKRALSDTFKEYLLAEIEFSYAKDKLNYHSLRQQILQVALAKPSPAFYSFLVDLNLERPENLISPAFASFLRSYTVYMAQAAGYTKANEAYYSGSYNTAATQLKGKALLLAQAQILWQSIQFGHLQYTEQMLKDFAARNTDAAANDYLLEFYSANKDFAIGSPAPDFTLKDVNGQPVSLSDFKGKLVYLNFWRSTCGLCQMELPHMQDLIARLKGRKVVFLNVALDEDEAKWRRKVQEKQLLGEHLFQQGPDAALVQQYNLKDTPAYFLIDEEGRFITLKARRPSDHEVANEILRHLEVRQASLK